MNVYPIPVISVQDLCDIEIDLDNVCISTKLSKQNALSFNCDKVAHLEFEVFGVEDYLADYYLPGEEISTLLQKIKNKLRIPSFSTNLSLKYVIFSFSSNRISFIIRFHHF